MPSFFSFNSTNCRFKCSGVKPQATGGDTHPRQLPKQTAYTLWEQIKDPTVHVEKWLRKAAWVVLPLRKPKPISKITFYQ